MEETLERLTPRGWIIGIISWFALMITLSAKADPSTGGVLFALIGFGMLVPAYLVAWATSGKSDAQIEREEYFEEQHRLRTEERRKKDAEEQNEKKLKQDRIDVRSAERRARLQGHTHWVTDKEVSLLLQERDRKNWTKDEASDTGKQRDH